jgi:hypothetical protein
MIRWLKSLFKPKPKPKVRLWICKVQNGKYIKDGCKSVNVENMDRPASMKNIKEVSIAFPSGLTENIEEAFIFGEEIRLCCIESATIGRATFIEVG